MICIVIPTYNEKENIFKLINKILSINLNIKLVIVDDSIEKLIKLNKIKKVKYIYRGKKLGRGSAVLMGMRHALKDKNNKIIIEMDADFSHNPKELKRNINHFIKNKINFLIASRYIKNSKIINWPLSRRLLSKFSNILAKFLLGVPIKDYTNGFRFYDRTATKHIYNNCKNSKSSGFILLSEIALELYNKNFKIDEIQTVFVNRTRGESKADLKEIFTSFMGLIKLFLKKKLL